MFQNFNTVYRPNGSQRRKILGPISYEILLALRIKQLVISLRPTRIKSLKGNGPPSCMKISTSCSTCCGKAKFQVSEHCYGGPKIQKKSVCAEIKRSLNIYRIKNMHSETLLKQIVRRVLSFTCSLHSIMYHKYENITLSNHRTHFLDTMYY